MTWLLLSLLVLEPPSVDAAIDTYAKAAVAQKAAEKATANARIELDKALEAQRARLKELGYEVGPVVPPKPPIPNDPLLADVKAAYTADTAIDKAETLLKLIEVMRRAQIIADGGELNTINDLAGTVGAASKMLVGDKLAGVRAVYKKQILEAFPFDERLTPEIRQKAKDLFKRFENVLTEVSK